MTLELVKSSYIDASLILVVSIEVTPSGYLRYIFVYVDKWIPILDVLGLLYNMDLRKLWD